MPLWTFSKHVNNPLKVCKIINFCLVIRKIPLRLPPLYLKRSKCNKLQGVVSASHKSNIRKNYTYSVKSCVNFTVYSLLFSFVFSVKCVLSVPHIQTLDDRERDFKIDLPSPFKNLWPHLLLSTDYKSWHGGIFLGTRTQKRTFNYKTISKQHTDFDFDKRHLVFFAIFDAWNSLKCLKNLDFSTLYIRYTRTGLY